MTAARKIVDPVSPPPPPPEPSQAEVDEALTKLALERVEPQFQTLVRLLLRVERMVDGWERLIETLPKTLKEASLPELDAALQLFAHTVSQQHRDYDAWLVRAEQQVADTGRRPPSYRASIGEVWRRTYIAVTRMLERSHQALRMIGAEKAERFSTSFTSANPDSYTEEHVQDLAAAALYKSFADIVYETTCDVIEEGEGPSRSFIVSVPVPAGIERPHRVFAEKEESVHKSVETAFPELLGRTYIRYTKNVA